jgi:glycosyltransferase involved in cell wall biosynthesis
MSVNNIRNDRVAWLLPSMGTGGISFQHILSEFSRVFPNTITFTGQWPGYAPSFDDSFVVQEVGATRYVEFGKAVNGYAIGFSLASPQIIRHLLQFKPQVIFANAFTAWTMIALLLKPICRWKVIITYEGGSSVYESTSSTVRYRVRRFMAMLTDAFVVNSKDGKSYLLDTLKVIPKKVFSKPFLVPSVESLLYHAKPLDLKPKFQNPIFLYVGQIVPRKGLKILLDACLILKSQGFTNYTLLVVGDGEQRPELEKYVNDNNLTEQVEWVGKVPYGQLGSYFEQADVFVFPTYDDIWGMVLVEAMAFGNAVICSTGAGALEMLIEGENGFSFPPDPDRPELLAELMLKLIKDPDLVKRMGRASRRIMSEHLPAQAISSFSEAINSL